MMAHDNSKADPQEVEHAQAMWQGFVKLIKWSTIATIIVLIFLALFFV